MRRTIKFAKLSVLPLVNGARLLVDRPGSWRAVGANFFGINYGRMSRRSKAREIVVQMLYQVDLNPDVDTSVVYTMIDEQIGDEKTANFAKQLFGGAFKFRDMLDERIVAVAENWSLSRMAPTDRNVLRLGAYELIQTETPHPVVINEAIELARKFGNDQSPQFVNGILDKLVPPEKRSKGRPSSAPSRPRAAASPEAPPRPEAGSVPPASPE